MGGVRTPLIWVIRIVTLLVTLLITTHEPPSSTVDDINPASPILRNIP